jgi:hypothetical protein
MDKLNGLVLIASILDERKISGARVTIHGDEARVAFLTDREAWNAAAALDADEYYDRIESAERHGTAVFVRLRDPREEAPEIIRLDRATLYREGDFGFGYRKHEVRNVRIRVRPYAQYRHAVEVTFTPRGARRPRQFYETSHASLIVFEGWGHSLTPESMYGRPSDDGVAVSKHTAFSPEWGKSFAEKIASYDRKPVVSYVGHNPY